MDMPPTVKSSLAQLCNTETNKCVSKTHIDKRGECS